MEPSMDYKPNSHKYKQQLKEQGDKKVEKVVHGNAKTRKKSQVRKFTDVFISEDASNVKSYILMDVLVPTIKKAISDIVKDGIDMILGTGGPSTRSTNASKVSYRNYYDRRDNERNYTSARRNTTGYSYDDIILETRGEAEEVITAMDGLMDTYGIVSVADLYDLVGIQCNYTDNKYGWTNIRNVEPIRVRDGYMLKLPKAMPID